MHSVLIVQLIWAFFPIFVRGGVTLTTAIPWNDQVSVKPTAFYRRIAVDRYVEDRSKVSPVIFHKKETVNFRRQNIYDLWEWDYWCQFQAQKGNCTENLTRYYYDSKLDQCSAFFYSGCYGNKNNFRTVVECERYCKGASLMPVKVYDSTMACSLQPNNGLCIALRDTYYYDVNEGACKVFAYSGCGGNRNRFATEKHCLHYCGKTSLED